MKSIAKIITIFAVVFIFSVAAMPTKSEAYWSVGVNFGYYGGDMMYGNVGGYYGYSGYNYYPNYYGYGTGYGYNNYYNWSPTYYYPSYGYNYGGNCCRCSNMTYGGFC